MRKPVLIVIQGAPASGKTTLCGRLKKDVSTPLIEKDDIKELLFDRLRQLDREYSKLQGKASFEMLYAIARTFLLDGKSIIIEGAFFSDVCRPKIQAVLEQTGASYLEVYCHVDEETRRQRFANRAHDGTRHAAHTAHTIASLASKDSYEKLDLGLCIDMDTTKGIQNVTYNQLLQTIQQMTVEEGK
jgi:predicted kinase